MDFHWDSIEGCAPDTTTDGTAFRQSLLMCRHSSSETTDGIDHLVFSKPKDFDDFGDRIASVFQDWRQNKSGVILPQILFQTIQAFGIAEDHPMMPAALVAAVLGEIPHKYPYHNNHHFREAALMTMKLAYVHNHLPETPQTLILSPEDILLLFIAASIHDFAHDGLGNVIDGVHMPSRLEKRSYQRVKPFLESAGLGKSDLEKLEIFLISTDVSRNAEGRSPSGIARDIYKAHLHGALDMLHNGLFYQPLVGHEKLSLMAVLLGEADVSLSSGLSYAFAKDMTRLVAEESCYLQPSANTLKGFMEVICQGGFLTRAGQIVFGQNFQAILLAAQEDAKNSVIYGT